jgi:hypothetical protein
MEGGILKEYVDRLSGEPARLAARMQRPSLSQQRIRDAVEAFMNIRARVTSVIVPFRAMRGWLLT